jgi:predicted ATPase/DNA-binding winged helix-turn-helix (wHTH) protein
VLEKSGNPVKIGDRALDILLTLIEQAPEVVSKRALFERVWGTQVEEGALRFGVAALRTALGEDESNARYIVNVRGRGYCLATSVVRTTEVPTSRPSPSVAVPHLPKMPLLMIGRDDEVQEITRELRENRFVSIVGAGGIGKTTAALTVAHQLLAEFPEAIRFIDLGGLEDARLVVATLASELAISVISDQTVPAVLAFLRERRMLLVFDSCEHVIEAVAVLAEKIFCDAPQVHILTTSREALRAEGEHVRHLCSLGCPPVDSESLTAQQALGFPAVQLFVKQVANSGQAYELSDSDAPFVAEICRRLDGIPLALELAASRAGVYGVQGTASLLDQQFRLWRGRRTSLPRHQTLTATLDWSYNLLSDTEQLTFRRLAVFGGGFSLDAALDVVAEGLESSEATEALAALVEKSLVTLDSTTEMRYRLLDTTRSYAARKLTDSGESMNLKRHHCERMVCRLEEFNASVAIRSSPESVDFVVGNLSELRGALEWSFSDPGDAALGTRLIAASACFFMQLSLLTECVTWTERAIGSLEAANRGTTLELELQACLALSLMATKGNVRATHDALIRALDVADTREDASMQLLLLHGLYEWKLRSGDFRDLMELTTRVQTAAKRIADPAVDAISKALIAITCFFMGDNRETPTLARNALGAPVYSTRLNLASFGYTNSCGLLPVLARNLWRQGYPDQAVSVSERAVSAATDLNHPASLCYVLMSCVVVPLKTGDWQRAEELIQLLLSCAMKHRLVTYSRAAVGWQGRLAVLQDDLPRGIALLRAALAALREDGYELYRPSMTAALAEGLAKAGELDLAYSTICEAIAWCENHDRSLELLDLWRLKGEILISISADPHEGEACLMTALRRANEKELLSLELRSAIGLAKLWLNRGLATQGLELLSPIYGRFSEGFRTRDLVAAANLLDELRRVAGSM